MTCVACNDSFGNCEECVFLKLLSMLQPTMSIRNRIVYGYALVLGIAIAGTATGLALGNDHQRRALAIRDVAATEQQLLNSLQIKILYNRPAQQLAPHLNNRDRFEEASQKLLERISEIQTILTDFSTLADAEGHEQGADSHNELHELLEGYAETTTAFQALTQSFTQEILALPDSPERPQAAQQMLLSLVQSPEFAEFIQLPDQLEPLTANVEKEALVATAALKQAEILRNRIIVASLLASTTIAIIIALLTSRAIARPLTTVTQVARRVTDENNFDLQVPVGGHDEVGVLAESFNKLIQQVKQLLDQVRQKNTDLSAALTQLKQQQIQLVQSEKMSSLGQLVAGVAHEINNPVNFIHGNLTPIEQHVEDVLALVAELREQHPEAIATIEETNEDLDLEFIQQDLGKILSSMKVGTDRIRQIVLSLRNFSRLDEADCKAVDIHEGINSSLMILQHRFKAKPHRPAITVNCNYGDLPSVQCYPGQLNQVIINILTNAIDAIEERYEQAAAAQTPIPMEITIATQSLAQDWVEIAIADTGIGMSETVKQKLFDAFFTTKPEGIGTGIGMSISHKIITETHQGRLSYTSTAGAGTTFYIRIPLNLAPKAENIAPIQTLAPAL